MRLSVYLHWISCIPVKIRQNVVSKNQGGPSNKAIFKLSERNVVNLNTVI